MSDFDSSLPIRTENAGDVAVKIVDSTIPSQQLTVEADGSINVNAIFAPGTEVKITDGTDDLEINADGSINSVVSATDLDIRDLAFATDSVDVSGSSVTVSATDLDIRDLAFATDKVDASGSEVSLDAATLAALENINAVVTATDLDIRDLAFATDKVDVSGSSVTVSATDLDIRDLAFATDSVDVSGSSVTVTATDLDVRDLAFATDKVDVSGSSVTVSATDLDVRDLAFATDSVDVSGSSVTVSATDLDIRDLAAATDSVAAHLFDEAGVAYSAANPLPVSISADISGDEINNYNTAAAVAGGASSNHDYTVSAAKTLLLKQIEASGSGKMKIEVQIETAAASGVFNTRFVQFNSTAQTNMSIHLEAPISVATGVRVRVIRTNRDNQAQDLYSTISGFEV